MVAVLAGARVRERRLALGLRQAAVAAAAGISPAYLNLIEHDRRPLGGAVLGRLAAALAVDVRVLGGGPDAVLLDDLRAAAAADAAGGAEVARVEEFVARFPGWARLVARTGGRAAALERALAVLNDRVGQDPHLAAALHEVISAASAVRSTAAILTEFEDVEPAWQRRFLANIHADSGRMAAGAEALVAYLDAGAGGEALAASPQEEVEGWLAQRGWALPELEPGGPGVAALAGEVAGLASAAARRLAEGFVAEAAAEARALPAVVIEAALAAGQDDPLLLAARAGLGPLAAMRRLALRPGAPEGLVICDAAGAILLRKPVAGFALPRGGAGCALWPLYAALARPGVPLEVWGLLPGPLHPRHRLRAVAESRWPGGFGGVEVRQAAMLIAPEAAAGTPAGALPEVPVGGTCRICPRAACPARREPSILSEAGAAEAAGWG